MTYLVLFAFTFVSVFLRSRQQLNVVHYKWSRIPLTSYGMQLCQVASILLIVELSTPVEIFGAVLSGGTGACLGCFLGMWLHKRQD